MRRFHVPTLGLLAALAMAVACSSPSTKSGDGPEAALQSFYRQLNDGNYGEAKSQYGAEARRILDDPDTASADGFAQWAKTETKNGAIKSVSVVQSTEEGEARATVEYRVVYGDGSSVNRSVTMTLEDGEWKVGLIG